jgi:thiamine biosynthesis lipoprotein
MRRRAQPWLGTIVEISIGDDDYDYDLAAAFERAFESVALVHRLMSFHSPDSELARINRASIGDIVEIDPHTYTVLQKAQEIFEASAGLFDIRVGGCLMNWHLLPLSGQKPIAYLPRQKAYTLAAERQLKKLTSDCLDLGGIAKGYAVDLAVSSLQEVGVRNACVNAGGDLRVIGESDTEVLLRDPAEPSSMIGKLHLRNQALATSASYFSVRESEHGKYSALVNGQTGEPILDKKSISVSASECMLADALTKVVMASANAEHPCLAQFGAHALII